MKPLIALLVFAFSVSVSAEELNIIDVRKNIPLSDDEPAYKDFYLAGGSVGSLKKNMVVTAVRKVGIRDARGTQTYGEIEIPVGQLRILAVYDRVAVAREYKILSRDEHPMLEQVGLMSGDRIDLKGSFIDNKPLPKPKAVSEVTPLEPLMPLPTPAPAPVEAPVRETASEAPPLVVPTAN